MNRALLLPLLAALTACSPEAPQAATTPTAQPPAKTTSATPTVPAKPEPAKDGPCPYLDTKFVAEANGQLVRKVMLSADEPHPTCFFYANATEIQLTVRIYVGDKRIAKTLVNEAAGADASPATVPEGWSGGSMPTQSGAVYAVAKDGAAVVVTTNQKQTIKARRIAETAIGNLKLGY
ncbi:hypothetical protein Lesp02_48620 [Lentzea sp. NBRC 105346]|uniref:DUF2020 domain-containing protein n=1 Tax=Lentzea sp. NBRC 105346 TaxID=3032205 RepID=UPI00249FD0B1|nr:DUF2020 domain-containing protein [Lentzea sp. NBRC 105346]GLZ32674.1 hypothetical protein Lesp02_48620 [Lentzea sp. NBRC 105346]